MLVVFVLIVQQSCATSMERQLTFFFEALNNTLKVAPGFRSAIDRLQHMRWSIGLKRIPEFIVLKTYFNDVGLDVDKLMANFKNFEENFPLDTFGQLNMAVPPSFQPYIESVFTKIPRSVLVDTCAISLASYPEFTKFCTRVNGVYVKELFRMMGEQHHGKIMIIDFLRMDLSLEDLFELFVEIVSVGCLHGRNIEKV